MIPRAQKFFSISSTNSTTSTPMTSTTTTKDDDTLHLIIILVPCIVIALFISAILASLYCYRKKVLCFSKKAQKSKNSDDDKEAYVLTVSKIVDNAKLPHEEPPKVYGTYDNPAYSLNAAWDDVPEPQERSSISSINFAEAQVVDTEFDYSLPTFVNNDPYEDNQQPYQMTKQQSRVSEEDTTTFSPMQGFVSSLLSRYDNETNTRPVGIDGDANAADNEEDFESNEEVKDQGLCLVKSNFNPNTFQYKSTPGLLGITKGEKLLVLQKDLGSGWTCVRNPTTHQTGFVPSRNLKHL